MSKDKFSFAPAKKENVKLPSGGRVVPIKPGKNKMEKELSSPNKAKKLLSPAELKEEQKVDDSFHVPREKRARPQKIEVECYQCKKVLEIEPALFNNVGMNICDDCLANKSKVRRRR